VLGEVLLLFFDLASQTQTVEQGQEHAAGVRELEPTSALGR
jgi:hypothetical protein